MRLRFLPDKPARGAVFQSTFSNCKSCAHVGQADMGRSASNCPTLACPAGADDLKLTPSPANNASRIGSPLKQRRRIRSFKCYPAITNRTRECRRIVLNQNTTHQTHYHARTSNHDKSRRRQDTASHAFQIGLRILSRRSLDENRQVQMVLRSYI